MWGSRPSKLTTSPNVLTRFDVGLRVGRHRAIVKAVNPIIQADYICKTRRSPEIEKCASSYLVVGSYPTKNTFLLGMPLCGRVFLKHKGRLMSPPSVSITSSSSRVTAGQFVPFVVPQGIFRENLPSRLTAVLKLGQERPVHWASAALRVMCSRRWRSIVAGTP